MKKQTALAIILSLSITGVALAADNQARARAVHASPDAPNVDILVNDAVAIPDLEFNEVSDYASLDANVYNFKIVPEGMAGPVVLEADLSLFFNTDYTIVAVGLLSELGEPTDTAFGGVVLEDDNTPVPADMSRVRLLHASPGAPEVDVRIDGGPYLFTDIEYKEVGDYVMIPAGTADILVEAEGVGTVPFMGVTFEGATSYTVFATGLVGGEPAFGLLPSADSGAGAVDPDEDDEEEDDDEGDDYDDRRGRFFSWWKSRS